METKSEIRKPNPKEKMNLILSFLFVHMIPIITKNYKKGIREADLFEPLEEHKSHLLGDKLDALWKKANNKYKKYALHIALLRLFGLQLFLIGVLKLVNNLLLIFVIPTALGELISYFDRSSDMALHEASIYSTIIIGYLFIYAIIDHPSTMAVMHICMKLRVSCCSLIYRKSLKLSRAALAKTSVGQIINLMSNDVSKFDEHFLLCPYVIIAPLQSVLATYLLYRIIGIAAFGGITFLLLFIPLQIYLSKWVSVLRLRSAERTDERVRLMNEILNGIQVIKMYTWEKPFAKLVSIARRHEIRAIRIQFFLKALMLSFESFVPRTSIFISLVIFVVLGSKISAKSVFSVITIYNILRPFMNVFFSLSLGACAEVFISIQRIQEFLRHEEQSNRNEENSYLSCTSSNFIPHISLKAVCAKWGNENSLTNLNFNVSGDKLIAIIGPVGSGKSSFFNVILNELQANSGHMQILGKLSYASQEPWIFAASIKENILFGEEYEETRYKRVLKACALDSDLAEMPYGDKTIVGERGKSLSGGQKSRINLARCIYRQADIYLLDDPLSAVDSKVGKVLFEECIQKFLKDKMCMLITHQFQYLKNTDKVLVIKNGYINQEGTFDEVQSSCLDFVNLSHNSSNDKETLKSNSQVQELEIVDKSYDDISESDEGAENLVIGNIKPKTYFGYLKAGGYWLVWLVVAPAFIATQMSMNVSDYFVSYWVNVQQELEEINNNDEINQNKIIFVYTGITTLIIVLGVCHYMLFYIFATRASIKLHDTTFKNISNATMLFFNENPVGRILNRFSKDMGIIDNYIPIIFAEFVEIALMLFGAVTLAGIVNFWLLIPSFGLILTFYTVRVVYLETSRSVKRIEGISRSPIYTHMTTTINGLSTIRAFLAQDKLIRQFDQTQDHHSSAWYLFISASAAFGFWLDVIGNIFISCVIVVVLFINKDYYGGDVGLVITQYLSLNGVLQWGMHQLSELENNMTSVERVLEYNDVPVESTRDPKSYIPVAWPELGKIAFKNVSMKYSKNSEPILNKLNFTIYPGEKIGIVGRTGAGKTSTTLALFQLYEITGSILIDDIDIVNIPLDILRSKIAAIPQDPVLFTGSIRKNLDPFEEYSDDVLWSALEEVELKESIDRSSGLMMNVTEGGSNFSVGQRQLVCLARAIIRNQKILILDEATANVDPYTDNLIQKTIRKRFLNCTVITIAHRLHTIMDADRVMVFNSGSVVEFDQPCKIMEKENGVFYSMVQATGLNYEKSLYNIT